MADGVIDSLSIEIGASSNTAVNNINKLVSAMKALKDATSKIDNGAAGKLRDLASALKELGDAKKINISSKLGENIGALAGAMKAVKSDDISKLRQVASAVKTFDGVKNVNINSRLANNIVEVASAVSLLEKTHFEKITQFGNALKALSGGDISISKTLADRLKEIAAAVDTISNDTLDKIRQLTKALARLKGIGDVKIRISGVGSASAGGNNGNNPLPGGSQNSGQQSIGGSSGSGQTGVKEQIQWTLSLKKNISLIAAEWEKVGQAISSAIPTPLKLVLSIVGGIAKAVWNVAKAVWNVAKGIAKWAFNTAISAVKKLASGIKSLAKTVVNVGKKLFQNWYDSSVFKAIANGLEKIKSIISTFGRIAFYRAVRSAIKYVTDALKEGTENAYWYSKLFGDATKYISEAYDQMSSSNFKMSNQLGAAWSTLIATIEPIIIEIIELVTRAAEAVTQFFAVLSGKTVYMKAIDYTKDWADVTDEGAAKAKEWKNQLMGFDEINRLEEPSSSVSGKGEDKYKDYENMFEEADIGGIFKKIKELIDSGEWGKLGSMLGEKFNELVNKFDWSGWGTKIGKGIQKGIDFAYNFLNKADFVNLGKKIAEFFNRLGDGINFEQLGRTVRKLKLALWNILYGAVIGLEWDKWAVRISEYISGSLNELAEWLGGLSPEEIAQALSDFFGNIKYDEIKAAFVNVVQSAWRLFVDTKDLFLQSETGQQIIQKLKEFFENLTWDDIKESLKIAWTNLWSAIDAIWPKEDREAFGEAVVSDLKKLFNNVVVPAFGDIGSIFADLGKAIGESIWSSLLETKFGKLLNAIVQIAGGFLGLQDPITAWKNLIAGFATTSSDTSTSVSDSVKQMADDTETYFDQVNTASDYTTAEFGDMAFNADMSMQSMSDSVKTESSNISGSFKDEINKSANDVANEFSTMSSTGNREMNSLSCSVSSASSGIVASFNRIISAAKEAFRWSKKAASVSGSGNVHYNLGGAYDGYANGGFPEDGLFYANHGELVGKFSNGKTAVANNEQITEGIANAVYGAFVRAYSETGNTNKGSKVAVLNVNGREFARAIFDDTKAVEREHGISLITA